jgi:hypothetical protein
LAQGLKHNNNREPDLETVNVEVIQVAVEPANQKVIRNGQEPYTTA